jgi:hypothetical protein
VDKRPVSSSSSAVNCAVLRGCGAVGIWGGGGDRVGKSAASF